MIWVDYFLLGIILLSALIGLGRGFIREVIALVIWAVAIFIAWQFAQPTAGLLTNWVSTPSLRIGIAALLLVITVLLIGAIIAHLLTMLVERTGLTGTDRLLGFLFGAARGAVVCALLVFLASVTPLIQDPWWQQSQLIGHFQHLASQLQTMIPPDWASQLKSL